MIDCKYFEDIDVTPWHSDVFDHPSYQSFCHLKDKNIHRYWCAKCENYIPDCESLSDYDIVREFRLVKEKLETDDRTNPISKNLINKLIEQKKVPCRRSGKKKYLN